MLNALQFCNAKVSRHWLRVCLFDWRRKLPPIWRNSAVWGILLFQFPKYLFRLGYLVSKICSQPFITTAIGVGRTQVLSRRLLVSGCRHLSRLHSPFTDKYFLLTELHIMVVWLCFSFQAIAGWSLRLENKVGR